MSLEIIIKELEVSARQVKDEELSTFIGAINSHKRIFVYGTGRTGLMLKTFAMRLMQLGYNSYVIGETTTPSIEDGDLLIVASASGETSSVCNAADEGVKQGATVIVLTGSNASTLSTNHEPLIRIDTATKYAESKASVQPLGSLFEQMLLIIFDGIVLMISSAGEDKNKSMSKRHASIE
ncbi:6-phospho-3-hexuloisomerase [Tannockella kyphosi]|uniref:6-phospho-3-hexuloisomerase n=1 Tax=Tannockella kyphosi TaxID=2899121 RepID=UPI0020124DCE|nr:6-phospho-3-hexuloisomerase [Tannockella kyphosi]